MVFEKNATADLVRHLVILCKEMAAGRYGDAQDLFELTKKNTDTPPDIRDLAESFGMMLIQVEAREFHARKLIEELEKVQAALEQARLKLVRENVGLKQSLGKQYWPRRIIGQNPRMLELMRQVEKVADTPINVLITGETGTGKELIARALHYNSIRREGPFIALNCTAIPESLIESELFGIEKGVATGIDRRAGRIEQAHSGTLFLDEIGDMPLTSQAKVLRVLENRRVLRIGAKKSLAVDIRIVTATNKDLRREVAAGRFREDLFFRINVAHFLVPPLRDRPDDIPLLLKSFLKIASKKMTRKGMRFAARTLALLTTYAWPGNVRELENEVERLVALSDTALIQPEDLSPHISQPPTGRECSQAYTGDNLKDTEMELILRVLREAGDNKTRAARRLGISREGLRKKLKRYGVS